MFLEILNDFKIEKLIDVRRFPGSRKFPQFNKETLKTCFTENNIEYLHLESLGGRRKTTPDSKNTIWRHPSFRGYADYMETEDYKKALRNLKNLAAEKRSAIMCSEVLWWSCHRSLISDSLKAESWKVMHIMGVDKANEHPYTQPAKIINGKLIYSE